MDNTENKKILTGLLVVTALLAGCSNANKGSSPSKERPESKTNVEGSSKVNACLAVEGVLTQALTKNPLAAPSILGINSDAVFFTVVAASMPNVLSPVGIVWAAFGGLHFHLLQFIF